AFGLAGSEGRRVAPAVASADAVVGGEHATPPFPKVRAISCASISHEVSGRRRNVTRAGGNCQRRRRRRRRDAEPLPPAAPAPAGGAADSVRGRPGCEPRRPWGRRPPWSARAGAAWE